MSTSTRQTLALTLLVLTVAACGDDGGTGQGGGGTTSTSASATVTGSGGASGCGPAIGLPVTDACRTCTEQHCCAESQACGEDPTCAAVTACGEQCGADVQCRVDNCFPLTGGGIEPVGTRLELCTLENCEDKCHVTLPCEQLNQPEPPGCGACLVSQCCDEVQTLYSPDVLRFWLCQADCLDYGCIADCDATYSATIAAIKDFATCQFGPSCGDVCTPPGACGGVQFGDPSCGSCATSNPACCDLFATCSTDPFCIDYFNCHNACTTPSECAECASLFPLASAGYKVAAENCLAVGCPSCGIGQSCGQSHRIRTGTCRNCIEQSCCGLGTACGTDPTCAALDMCMILCAGDATCRAGCQAEFPGAATAYGDFEACLTTSCAADCP